MAKNETEFISIELNAKLTRNQPKKIVEFDPKTSQNNSKRIDLKIGRKWLKQGKWIDEKINEQNNPN